MKTIIYYKDNDQNPEVHEDTCPAVDRENKSLCLIDGDDIIVSEISLEDIEKLEFYP